MFDTIIDYLTWLSHNANNKNYTENNHYSFFDGDKELDSSLEYLQKIKHVPFKDLSFNAPCLDLVFSEKIFPLKIRETNMIYVENKSLVSLKELNTTKIFLSNNMQFSATVRYCFHTWNNVLDIRELYNEQVRLVLEFHCVEEMKYHFPINQHYKSLRFVGCTDRKLYDMDFYDIHSNIEKIVFDDQKHDFKNLTNVFSMIN